MAYRLKTIKYKDEERKILLQNENGPCPLLAAGNVLLLKQAITLPPNCVKAGVVTIEELTNVLFEKILLYQPTTSSSNAGIISSDTTGPSNNDNNNIDDNHSHHHIQEVLQIFPSLQFGMDVNPKFSSGPTGMEYTKELNAFDLLHIELVHGWLLDPTSPHDEHMMELIGHSSYNELVNRVIEGNDAATELEKDPNPYAPNHEELSTKATKGSVIRSFLEGSGHQLTQYGLQVLHEYVREGEFKIFFRNNHFNTLTKHSDGHLYLLVTDIGFANLPLVVFEKLDVIDGDTEYVTGEFKIPPAMARQTISAAATGEQLLAGNPQAEADYQLALQLSQENGQQQPQQSRPRPANTPTRPPPVPGARQGHRDSDLERALQASMLDQQQLYEQHQQSIDPPAGASNPSSLLPSPGLTMASQTGTTVVLPPISTDAPQSVTTAQLPTNTTTQPQITNQQQRQQQQQQSQSQPVQSTTTSSSQAPAPVVALGVPATNLSQEDRDMMLAMQLQRQEEQNRQQATAAVAVGNNDEASLRLAQAMQRQERDRVAQRVAQPAPPPHRQPTAMPVGGGGTGRTTAVGRATKDNCVIS